MCAGSGSSSSSSCTCCYSCCRAQPGCQGNLWVLQAASHHRASALLWSPGSIPCLHVDAPP
jgi:hypothetical protein